MALVTTLFAIITIYKRGQADAELFGGQNVSDTFAIPTGEHTKIFSIKTDNEIAFFEIFSTSNPGNDCYILGKSKNGNFVKYLDTEDITKRFFGTSTLQAHFSTYYQACSCKGDTIIIPYLIVSYFDNKHDTKRGEFRFKWDDAAQWFGVEQVVY